MRIDSAGDLILEAAGGELRLHKPVLYQKAEGIEHPVDGRVREVVGGAAERDHVGVRRVVDEVDPLEIRPRITVGEHEHGSRRMRPPQILCGRRYRGDDHPRLDGEADAGERGGELGPRVRRRVGDQADRNIGRAERRHRLDRARDRIPRRDEDAVDVEQKSLDARHRCRSAAEADPERTPGVGDLIRDVLAALASAPDVVRRQIAELRGQERPHGAGHREGRVDRHLAGRP